jgi:predicted DNA-binding transcriptional regulator YafY
MVAGVPVFSVPGPTGGYRLMDGWQMRLTGLTADEAEALFLAGLPGPATELGLGAVVSVAGLKLESALPADLRRSALRIRSRFHLDPSGWFAGRARHPHLTQVAGATWDQRRITVRYRGWDAEVVRTLDPLGVVLKAGVWYLVARSEEGIRTYTVSQMEEVATLDETFDAPDDFDLEAFWRSNVAEHEASMYPAVARVRMTPWARRRAAIVQGPGAQDWIRRTLTNIDEDGVGEAELPLECDTIMAALDILALGPGVEVLAPASLRQAVADQAAALAEVYRREVA